MKVSGSAPTPGLSFLRLGQRQQGVDLIVWAGGYVGKWIGQPCQRFDGVGLSFGQQ